MKSIVIYFSQTGNTEKVARAIQAGITQVTGAVRPPGDTRYQPASPQGLRPHRARLAGLRRVPEERSSVRASSAVRGRQARLQLLYARHHARGLLAHSLPGARGPGSHRHRLGRLVRRLLPPAHAAALPDGGTSGCHRPRRGRGLRQRDGPAQHAHPGWGNRSHTPCAPAPSAPPALLPPGPSGDAPRVVGSFSRLLKFDKEKCLYPSCTLCMDNCPMHGMDLSVDPPILAKPCLDCEFCARLCPTGALDMTHLAGSHGRHDGRLQADDARLFGRSRERRTFQTADTAQ